MSREHAQYVGEAIPQGSEKKLLLRDMAWSQGTPHSVVRGINKYAKQSLAQLKNTLFLCHCSVKIHILYSDPSDISGYSPLKCKPSDEVIRKKYYLLRYTQNRGKIGIEQ